MARLFTVRALAVSIAGHALVIAVIALALAGLRQLKDPFGMERFGTPMRVDLVTGSKFSAAPDKGPFPVEIPKAKDPDIGVQDGNTHAEGALGRKDGAQNADAYDRYLFDLKSQLESRKSYPVAARRAGESGEVVVRFDIARDGRIENAALKGPGASERLNAAAMTLVRETPQLPPLPDSVPGERVAVEVPIRYQLR